MQEVNGFAALLSGSLDLAGKLHSMDYRAWRGLAIRREGNLSLGLCLIDEDMGELPAIHGELYSNDLKTDLIPEVDDLADLLAKSDGNYSFVLPLDDTLIFARDPLGTKPLYYAKDRESFGVASDPGILQQCFSEVGQAEPGVLYRATQTSLARVPFGPLNSDIKPKEMESKEVLQTISGLLTESVRRRAAKRKNIVIGFSGGIDSVVLSVLASRYTNLTAATVCVEGSADYGTCEAIAERLGIPLKMIVVDERLVRDTLRRLSSITRFHGAMHASIACAVYILAKFAREAGADALMLGQLADELFGGYARYLKYLKTSADRASGAILNDVRNAHKFNFWRDEIACCSFTRLLLPYASLDLVGYALNLPLRMKLDADTGGRKIILREVAKGIGIDDELAEREKKAMQFSSGINKIVSRLQPH